MVTIIIFTNSNYIYLSSLLKDILHTKINIWIVDYGNNPNKINPFKKHQTVL